MVQTAFVISCGMMIGMWVIQHVLEVGGVPFVKQHSSKELRGGSGLTLMF